MAAHLYWKFADMTGGDGGYVSGCEAYFRQTIGGTNEIPVAATASGSYALPPSALYDGVTSTWWADNHSPEWVAFQYASPIDAIELSWEARLDDAPQAPSGGNIYWSDDGATWTFQASVSFAAWSVGVPQAVNWAPYAGIDVSAQAGLQVMHQPGLTVAGQAGLQVMHQPGLTVAGQVGFVVMIPTPPPPVPTSRRRQYVLM